MRTSLLLQLGPVPVLLERVRIGERFPVLHRPSVDDVADGELHDLAALRPGNRGDLDDLRGYVARRRVRANLRADPIDQRPVQGYAVAQPYEQDNTLVALPALTDDQTL